MPDSPEPFDQAERRHAIPGAAPRMAPVDAFSAHQVAALRRDPKDKTTGSEQEEAERPPVEFAPESFTARDKAAAAEHRTVLPEVHPGFPQSVEGWGDRYQDFVSAHSQQIEEDDGRRHAARLPDENRERFAANWTDVAVHDPLPAVERQPSRLAALCQRSRFTRWLVSDGQLDHMLVGATVLLMIGVPLLWHLAHSTHQGPIARSSVAEPRPVEWDQISAAWEVARKFLSAEGEEAKAQFVRHPEAARARMRKWYARYSDAAQKDPALFTAEILPDRVTIYALTNQHLEAQILTLVREKTDGSYLIDWEASTGWQEVDWERLAPAHFPVTVRAIARKEHYYSFAFVDERQYASYRLTLPLSEASVYAYALRGSPAEAQLQAKLSSSPFAGVELSLRLPTDFADHRQAEILEIRQMDWFPAQ